jgi:hypothetical protein
VSAFARVLGAVGRLRGLRVAVFGASGAGHAPGVVPDPGAGQGTAKFLREDATWAIPAGGGGAPTDAEYLVGAAHGSLSAERVVTDTASVTWDLATASQAKAKRAALTGDVTAAADSNATTIANDAVTLAKLANLATDTVIGRTTAGTGDPEAVPFADPAQAAAALAYPTVREGKELVLSPGPTGTPGWGSAHDAIRRRWSIYFDTAVRAIGLEITSQSNSFGADATGNYDELTTGTTAGNVAFVRDNISQNLTRPDQSPYYLWLVKTDATITSILLWLVSASTTFPSPGTDTMPGHGTGFRFSTDASDTVWQFATRDGTTQSLSSTTITVSASKLYLLACWTADAGANWNWYVRNVTDTTEASGTKSTNLPGTTQQIGVISRVETRTNAARKLRVYGMSGYFADRV